MRLTIFAAFLVCISSSSGMAQDAPGPGRFVSLSDGQSTCGEFIAEPEKRAIRAEWILGFITGVNTRAIPPYREVGTSFGQVATVIGWLQSYCDLHSLDTMVTAAEALRRDFIAHEGLH
jgi:hypothetical protein